MIAFVLIPRNTPIMWGMKGAYWDSGTRSHIKLSGEKGEKKAIKNRKSWSAREIERKRGKEFPFVACVILCLSV